MKFFTKLPILFVLSGCSLLFGEETYLFKSTRRPGQIDRVHVNQEVRGEVVKWARENEQRSEKIDVVWKLDYFEKSLSASGGSAEGLRSLRWYENAEANRRIGSKDSLPELQRKQMLLAVEVGADSARIFSPFRPMAVEDLELVDVMGNSLLLEGFLPAKPVQPGEAWGIPEKMLAPFCGWDVVSKSSVECTLREVTERVARFEASGRWKGAVNGVASEMEIKAKFRFDRRRGRIDWWGMLLRERRPISFVEGGLDVISRHEIRIAPAEDVPELADAAVKDLAAAPTADLLLLTQKAGGGKLEITHDRRWHLCNDPSNTMELRRVVQGEWTVQCKVSALPERSPGTTVSLEQFQEEVQKGLGENFGEIVEAAEKTDPSGRRIFRVAVRGVAKSEGPPAKDAKKPLELPMRWIYYHLSDARGRQAAVVFVMEEKYFDQSEGVDSKLVGSLKFLDPPEQKTAERGVKKDKG